MKLNKKILKRSSLLSLILIIITFSFVYLYNNDIFKLKGEVLSTINETNKGVSVDISSSSESIGEDETTKYINWNFDDTKTISVNVNFDYSSESTCTSNCDKKK